MIRESRTVCDSRCHNSPKPAKRCICWCGGVFHGHENKANRERFASVYVNHHPRTRQAFDNAVRLSDRNPELVALAELVNNAQKEIQ